ncbi:MAG: rod shape-determining protein MreD [Balneolaceae bacterium]
MIRSTYVRLTLIGLSMVAIQVVLLRHLEIFGATADLVLLFLIWLCTKKERVACLLFAASLGLLQDAFTDLWGVHMFSKVIVVFIAHSFLHRTSENSFLLWQVFLILTGTTFIHNLVFFGVSSFSGVLAANHLAGTLLFTSTLFTATLGGFLHLVRNDQ